MTQRWVEQKDESGLPALYKKETLPRLRGEEIRKTLRTIFDRCDEIHRRRSGFWVVVILRKLHSDTQLDTVSKKLHDAFPDCEMSAVWSDKATTVIEFKPRWIKKSLRRRL